MRLKETSTISTLDTLAHSQRVDEGGVMEDRTAINLVESSPSSSVTSDSQKDAISAPSSPSINEKRKNRFNMAIDSNVPVSLRRGSLPLHNVRKDNDMKTRRQTLAYAKESLSLSKNLSISSPIPVLKSAEKILGDIGTPRIAKSPKTRTVSRSPGNYKSPNIGNTSASKANAVLTLEGLIKLLHSSQILQTF
ncbi:hypothetical protein BC829DRAFT_113119 [Chytridium lagenaria]|nr:hypothetical protein BC829DRAFT_113119 [Chytridium lagenaria]